jgi:hypothetical protein
VRFRRPKRRSLEFWVDGLPVDLLWRAGTIGKPTSQPLAEAYSAATCTAVRALKLMQRRGRGTVRLRGLAALARAGLQPLHAQWRGC